MAAQYVKVLVGYEQITQSGTATNSIVLGSSLSVQAEFSTTAANTQIVDAEFDRLHAQSHVANAFVLSGVSFHQGDRDYITKATGEIQTQLSPITGIGTTVGTLTPGAGLLELTNWVAGSAPAISDFRGVFGPPVSGPYTPFNTYGVTFRTATSPVRPGSVTVLGTMMDDTTFNVAADTSGHINGTRVKGRVNYEFGVVELFFVTPTAPEGTPTCDLSFLGIPGVGVCFSDLCRTETLRYNAVAYTYLPLDAGLIGVDPVRLPSDGRVPIFRAGGFAVIGHSKTMGPLTVSNAQTIDVSRVRLSRVRVTDVNKAVINTGYSADLEAGLVTFTDVAGYAQPITIEDRVEDMLTVRDAQITGQLEFTRQVTHAYPVPGSFISSAMIAGDLKARVSAQFDQATWTSVWQDTRLGSAATGKFNDVLAPIVVTNKGAVSERWALLFTNTNTFNVIGEHVGQIATGNTATDLAPINPATGVPYFALAAIGWGSGWAAGNVLRINTVGAMAPVWAVRTIQQGPETVIDDNFTLLIRGDVDRP